MKKVAGVFLGVILALGAVMGAGVYAQISNPSGVSVEQVQALMPKPASVLPANEQVGGAVGAATDYMRADAKIPRITRVTTVSTDAGGNWSVTWATPLMSVPAVLPVPINATSQPVVCNVTTTSATGATGRCWLARTLPATLTVLTALISYDVFGATPVATQVQLIAIPPTQ